VREEGECAKQEGRGLDSVLTLGTRIRGLSSRPLSSSPAPDIARASHDGDLHGSDRRAECCGGSGRGGRGAAERPSAECSTGGGEVRAESARGARERGEGPHGGQLPEGPG